MNRLLTALILWITLMPGFAAEEAMIPIQDQPDLPAPVESGKPMDPDVTIIRRGDETIEEYRIENRVVMVRITPAFGFPYVFTDQDGDGNLEVRQSDNMKGMTINKWVLFSW